MAARARGNCNESAHFYGATAYHDWLQKVQWDFIQRMTLWLQALGSAIMAQQVAQDIARNFGEISKAKDAASQRQAFDESVARVQARNAKAATSGGTAEGAGGSGRAGPGGTQVLSPEEMPWVKKGPEAEAAPATKASLTDGVNVEGEPGPGITRDRLVAVQRLANKTARKVVIYGSRQTGVKARPPDHHIAFAAPNRAAVKAFYNAAISAGGKDNGAPGLRPQYHPNYYGAFVYDRDGNNVEVVCNQAE